MKTSAVLAVRDEAAMMEGALACVAFCDEVVVVIDDRSADATEEIARAHTPLVRRVPFRGFGALKNAGVELATGDWIVFCDADERVTPRLASQLLTELTEGTDRLAFRSPTVNFYWGRRMDHGGWRESHVKIARRDHALHSGDIHERLEIPENRIGSLEGERWHFSHRSIEDNLRKTILYGGLDADTRLVDGAPRVTQWTLLRTLARQFGWRMIRRAGWRDGMPGFVEGIYQPLGMFSTEVMLWERQNAERIAQAYVDLERAVSRQV